jgi:hypothetical protein
MTTISAVLFICSCAISDPYFPPVGILKQGLKNAMILLFPVQGSQDFPNLQGKKIYRSQESVENFT